ADAGADDDQFAGARGWEALHNGKQREQPSDDFHRPEGLHESRTRDREGAMDPVAVHREWEAHFADERQGEGLGADAVIRSCACKSAGKLPPCAVRISPRFYKRGYSAAGHGVSFPE